MLLITISDRYSDLNYPQSDSYGGLLKPALYMGNCNKKADCMHACICASFVPLTTTVKNPFPTNIVQLEIFFDKFPHG